MGAYFWIVLGGTALPVVSVIFGLILWKAAPGINPYFGFRTKRSMSSPEVWSFAQILSGKLFTAVYAPTSVISALVMMWAKSLDSNGKMWTFGSLLAVQILEMILINFYVERKLKTTFNENGEPRE